MPDFSPMNEFDGLQFIPVDENKRPIPKGWQKESKKHNLSNCPAIGLVCGKLSGSLEAIDFDLKYDLTGKLYERYKELVAQVDENLYLRMVVQKTKSGGYHWIYRCSQISGNIPDLARRPTTDKERQETWQKTYDVEVLKSDDATARKRADEKKKGDNSRVLIETRGEGGQIVISPSDGYELIHGDLFSISEITPEQRDSLHSIARMFNQMQEEYAPPVAIKRDKRQGVTPFDDFDDRGDVIALLTSHGYSVVKRKGPKTYFLRAGATASKTSGDYDENRKHFGVFSTSCAPFEVGKGYRPYAVYALLECGGNFQEAVKRLYEEGYGDRIEEKPKAKVQSTRVVESRILPDDDDLSCFATPADYDTYLHQKRTNTLPQGLTTGSPQLDRHFLFKHSNFVHINGIDNVGKSIWMWWLLLLASMHHGWRHVIFAGENKVGSFMSRMIEMYWGRPLYGGLNPLNDTEYRIGKEFVEYHFKLIKAQDRLYNYKDLMNLFTKANKNFGKFDDGLIDPYNALKIDLSGFSKLSTHEYHYEVLSEWKAFCEWNDFGMFVNHHAVTSAARLKDADRKFPVPPRKEDTEGGQKTPNKADDFITIHRLTQHPTDYNKTQVHVRKIKETETGGRPTPLDEPIFFEMYRMQTAFREVDMLGQLGIDPIAEWHRKREPVQGTMIDLPADERSLAAGVGQIPF